MVTGHYRAVCRTLDGWVSMDNNKEADLEDPVHLQEGQDVVLL